MNPKKLMLEGATPVASQLYVDDVFSTYTYTGTASGAVVNNGLDLASGGMVWVKSRSDTNIHYVCDSERVGKFLNTNNTNSQGSSTGLSLENNGFIASGSAAWGGSGINYASWSFKKAPKFFELVKYVGNGQASKVVEHGLGSDVGMLIVKCMTTSSTSWVIWHRGVEIGRYLLLNSGQATSNSDAATIFGNGTITVDPTSTSFTVGTTLNINNAEFIAYIFAHDPSEDGIIQCGSYVGNGSAAGPIVDLGWEPQYLLVKNTSGTNNWHIFDTVRGLIVNGNDPSLVANGTFAEGTGSTYYNPTSTGFQLTVDATDFNALGSTYVYMAIRRSNKPPQSGSDVLSLITRTGNGTNTTLTTGIPADSLLTKTRNGAAPASWVARLTGDKHLITSSTAAETSTYLQAKAWDVMDGVKVTSSMNGNLSTYIDYAFKRAPGFFDTVCYTGTGVARTVEHGLGAVPELMIVKARASSQNWMVYSKETQADKFLLLNDTGSINTSTTMWNNTTPTESSFQVGIPITVNASGSTYIAYLFASLPGISKVGSYTGNGTSQTINCGFTTGTRFVLVKRTDSTGDWYIWDSARGIISDNDPHLSLNTATAEVTTDDSVDPATIGFIVNQIAATNINVANGQYIYLAIA